MLPPSERGACERKVVGDSPSWEAEEEEGADAICFETCSSRVAARALLLEAEPDDDNDDGMTDRNDGA